MSFRNLVRSPVFYVFSIKMIESVALYALLEARRKELGWSQAEVGRRALNHDDGSAMQNIKRGSSPSFENLQRICNVLRLKVGIQAPSGFSEHDRSWLAGDATTAPDGFLTIPWRWPAPGRGSAPLAFQRAWFVALGIAPDNIAALAPTKSSLPRPSGFQVVALVDTLASRRGVGVWGFREAGVESITQVSFTSTSSLVILPPSLFETPRTVEKLVDSGIELAGRVVWVGQVVPFMGKIE